MACVPGVASRGSDRERLPFHVWLTGDHVVRVSVEQASAYPRKDRLWSATEFSDFELDVDELWSSAVSSRVVLTDR
jgi:hypothetical protein